MEDFAAFPLGTVLLPGQLLPLQVFEPRYKVMLFDLRDDDPAEFVVALIERGSEVGGGDVRASVGCVGRVLEQQDLPDGRALVVVLGMRAVLIDEWLEEDPYPRVRSTPVPQLPSSGETHEAIMGPLTDSAAEVATLAARLGAQEWPADMALAEDPIQRLWQLAMATPLGTLDRQKLLAETDPTSRADMLADALATQKELLEARLEWGEGPRDDPR